MKTVKAGGQVPRDSPQEVAGQGEDLQVVRAIECVVRKACIRQLVVVEIHRPRSHDQSASSLYAHACMDLSWVTCAL